MVSAPTVEQQVAGLRAGAERAVVAGQVVGACTRDMSLLVDLDVTSGCLERLRAENGAGTVYKYLEILREDEELTRSGLVTPVPTLRLLAIPNGGR